VKRPVMYAANQRNGVHQLQQLHDVVAIRACRDRAERNAIGVYEDVVLGPLVARDPWGSDRFFACPNGSYR
jgi:hypothetical protein